MKNRLIYAKLLRPKASARAKVVANLVFVAGVAALFYGASHLSEANMLRATNARVAGVVRQVIGFNRGFPILSVSGQRTYINHVPPAFGKYISPGDSVYKPSGEFTVTSYRKVGTCTEIITWQYGIVDGYLQPDIRTKKHCH